MKTFEVRFVEVYTVEADDEEDAYNLALKAHSEEPLSDDEAARVDYQHGDDTIREI